MNRKLIIAVLFLAGVLSACAPSAAPQPITVGGGTPRSAPSGTQVAARPVETLKGLGGKDCRFEFADQGILGICKLEITRAEVLAVPGLNDAILKGLLKIAVWVTANQALTLEPVTQADPIAWVIPWSTLAEATTRTGATSKAVPITGTPVSLRVSLSSTDCHEGSNRITLMVDLFFRGKWYQAPDQDAWMDATPCAESLNETIVEDFRVVLHRAWGAFSDIIDEALDDILKQIAP